MSFLYSNTSERIKGLHVYKEGEGIKHPLMNICDSSLLTGCDYIGIDINSSNKRVYGISGFFSIRHSEKTRIIFPKMIVDGSVFIMDDDMISGVSKDYKRIYSSKFDSHQRCLWFGDTGDINNKSLTIRVSDNLYLSLYETEIVNIIIKPLY